MGYDRASAQAALSGFTSVSVTKVPTRRLLQRIQNLRNASAEIVIRGALIAYAQAEGIAYSDILEATSIDTAAEAQR